MFFCAWSLESTIHMLFGLEYGWSYDVLESTPFRCRSAI
jgi:hypothetical protein